MEPSSADEVPTPTLVAAWERLGLLAAESVPLWAAHWLTQGLEGEAVVGLAGLTRQDVREVHDLLPQALDEAGVPRMTSARAAAKVAFDQVATLHLDGRAAWQWVIDVVCETISQNEYSSEFFDEPLANVYGLDDELSGRWGRSKEELAVAVRDACARQLAS